MSSPKSPHVAHEDVTLNRSAIIDSLPIAYMAYEAKEPYVIIDENKAHEAVALTKRENVIGRGFLDAFPDTTEEYKATGKSAPIESIKKIVRTGKPDSLGEFQYDVRDASGTFITKYWRSTQYPIFDGHKKVVGIYQLTEDITDRKTTEKQLALTKYQLDQTLANGQVGTWLWNIKTEQVFGDANLAQLYGLDSEKAETGLPLEKFTKGIYKADRARVTAAIERAIKERGSFESEYRTTDIEGSMRWVIARGRVEVDEKGELDRFPGVAIDITERKDAEQALTESENRLRSLADSMPQLVWVADAKGHYEFFNQRWYEYTGTTGDEDSEDPRIEQIHPDDRPMARRVWRQSLKSGEPYEVQYRLHHAPTGSYRWVIGRANPTLDHSGKPVKWYGTCTDIHEQKRATQLQTFLAEASKQMNTSLDYLKNLQKVADMCVPEIADWCSVDLMDDESGMLEQVVVAHADPEKVSVAKKYREHNPPVTDGSSGVSKVMKTGKPEFYPVITNELIAQYITDPVKRKFMLSLNMHSIIIVPIYEKDKGIGALSFVSTDSGRYYNNTDLVMAEELASRVSLAITNAKLYDDSVREIERRKELEQALLAEKEHLEQRVAERTKQLEENSKNLTRSNQELQDFAYVASHDLQEPLRKIQAFGNLLETEYGDSLGEGADYLRRMRGAASRMSTLISDLLAFSRVTTKAKPSERVDLVRIVQDVLSDLESLVADTGGTVKVAELPVVYADPTHMRQLFQNLVGNALKFHKPDEKPRVTIGYDGSDRDWHRVTVSDNGIGFDQKYADRIFAVFQRLHEREAYEGTGIGLAVCRKIVERYGGTISATSAKGKGATFTIELPKKRSKQS